MIESRSSSIYSDTSMKHTTTKSNKLATANKIMETFLLPLFPCIILGFFICVKRIFFDSKDGKNIPPSPMKLPIIGNFHQLGSRPNRNLQKLAQKYGPIMLLHLGSIPTLVVSSAEVANQIMKTHDLSFCSRPSLTMPNILLYGSTSISFSSYGDYWRRLKSIVVLKLLSNTRVKSYQKVREHEVSHLITMLEESHGNTVNMGPMFASVTNNVISRIALGRKFDGSRLPNLVKAFVEAFNVLTIGSYIPWLSWVDKMIGLVGNAEKIAKEFDEFLEGVIEEHEDKKKVADAKSNEAEDFVDILLDLQKDNTTGVTLQRDTLKALILEAFAAGTETTHASLEWALAELIRNPRVMKKLQQEVTDVAQGRSKISEDDLEKMPYLKAVIKESLRLNSPFPLLLPRISIQDVKLKGYDIPTDTHVIINVWAIGRDPTLWEDPKEFKPERFLHSKVNYQDLQFGWFPFGAGRRSCPGMQFSVPVLELAIANIVYKFDVTLANGLKNEDVDMEEEFGITIHLKSPLLVSVSNRL